MKQSGVVFCDLLLHHAVAELFYNPISCQMILSLTISVSFVNVISVVNESLFTRRTHF